MVVTVIGLVGGARQEYKLLPKRSPDLSVKADVENELQISERAISRKDADMMFGIDIMQYLTYQNIPICYPNY